MATKVAQVWPVNELGEIVAVTGAGTTNVTGFLNENQVPIDEFTGKVAIVGISANTPTLPVASATTLGGIKTGTGIGIDANGNALPPPAASQQPFIPATEKKLVISERVAVGTYRNVGYGFRIALKDPNRKRITIKNEITNTVAMEVGVTTATNDDFNVASSFPLLINPGQEAEITYETVQVWVQQARSGSAVLNQFVTIEREYPL